MEAGSYCIGRDRSRSEPSLCRRSCPAADESLRESAEKSKNENESVKTATKHKKEKSREKRQSNTRITTETDTKRTKEEEKTDKETEHHLQRSVQILEGSEQMGPARQRVGVAAVDGDRLSEVLHGLLALAGRLPAQAAVVQGNKVAVIAEVCQEKEMRWDEPKRKPAEISWVGEEFA